MSKTMKFKELNKKYEFVCNELVKKFCNKQNLQFDYWISDEVGGIASFSNSYFFNLLDIILDLETKQPKGLILNWQDEGVEFHISNEDMPHINYKSYIMGLRYEQLTKKNKLDSKIICQKKCGNTQPSGKEYNDICLNCGSSILILY